MPGQQFKQSNRETSLVHKARMIERRKEQLARTPSFERIYKSVNDAKFMSDLNRHFKRRLASSRFRKAVTALAKAAKRSVDNAA